jgi:AraC family transcriptional regulator, transcriptional activator of pobA
LYFCDVMDKVKNTIPVYDIAAISGNKHLLQDIIAEPFGAYLTIHPNLRAAHRHSFYHIVLFTEGTGYHTIDFEKFEVVAGQIYFMSPGQVHSWHFDGEVDGYVINFSEDIFHNFLANEQYPEQFTFFRSIAQESVFKLDEQTFTATTAAFQAIIRELHTPTAYSPDLIRLYLMELFIMAERNISNGVSTSLPQQTQVILYNFRKLINTWYAEKRLPKEYAALLYITPNHLNALCKDLLGKPAGAIIRDRVLLEAKRLLVNDDLGISQIAARLNFADNSHFTKFFKKYTNQTPEAFRQQSLANH